MAALLAGSASSCWQETWRCPTSGVVLVVIGALLCFWGVGSVHAGVIAAGFGLGWFLADLFGASAVTALVVGVVGALAAWVLERNVRVPFHTSSRGEIPRHSGRSAAPCKWRPLGAASHGDAIAMACLRVRTPRGARRRRGTFELPH